MAHGSLESRKGFGAMCGNPLGSKVALTGGFLETEVKNGVVGTAYASLVDGRTASTNRIQYAVRPRF